MTWYNKFRLKLYVLKLTVRLFVYHKLSKLKERIKRKKVQNEHYTD